MPPKKKKGKGKGKKKGKKKDDAQLELEDKYKRTMDEIEALKDHLAVRKQLTRRANVVSEGWQQRMSEAENDLASHKEDQLAINADMTRQYKTMQTEMGITIHQLETELERTHQTLKKTEVELKKTKEEQEMMRREKDSEINDLKMKISSMEKAYENILREALESLEAKIDMAKTMWEEKSTHIQAKNKQVLLEFGLNPLDI
ncbi:coiled-coil domain-containing protein 153-like [Haliotis rubra]|uniref:coiled-coil domain-containing protein 153-like n=1 Tax=Haliotis rubra TaxID=36100 RepID=UPI001EE5E944|nr:coiled-coil domain-containing protein 153-like [Haliotis rubra]